MNEVDLIQQNVTRHERIAHAYDDRHSEIYNSHEQKRLADLVEWITTEYITTRLTENDEVKVLDFGCGSGNLTRHFLANGCNVIAADVTPSFLEMVRKLDPNRTQTHLLNGVDLAEFGDGTFDMVVTYSVLHHVPDYLHVVQEFARVTKPGGIILIDHEASNQHWLKGTTLQEFRSKIPDNRSGLWYIKRMLSPMWWVKKVRKTLNPRYSEEGDIHVWPDDHVEWDKVRSVLEDHGVSIVRDEDYLLYQPHIPEEIYDQYKTGCADMHLIVAKKLSSPRA